MKKLVVITLSCFVLFALLLTACGSDKSAIPEDAALVIVGNVNQEIGWLEETIKSMESMDVKSTNSKGESDTYTGVSIKSLLEQAGVKPEATTIVFFADDTFFIRRNSHYGRSLV